MALTKNQQQAVDHDGHLLIVAGPGSGKTSTSVEKAIRILSDPQRSMVMVTFTREGANEMQKRLSDRFKALGEALPGDSRLIIATFHSLSIKHLFRYIPRQNVMSPSQQGMLLQDAVFSCNFAPRTPEMDEEKIARKGFETYQYSIDRSDLPLSDRELDLTMRLVGAYGERLHSTGMMDLYTVMRDCAIKTHEGVIPPLPFTDMLVDEGQDTDDLQRVWIFAHAKAGCNVTIVGDDDQSIYEWRQALGYQGMKSFLDQFNARWIELGDNFRCKAEILNHAVTLVERNADRLEKKLFAKRGKGGSIFAIYHPSEFAQYETLAGIIKDTPSAHSNAAILARNNNSLDGMEMELTANGISYHRIGKSIWENFYIAGYTGLLSSLLDGNPIGLLPVLQLRGLSPKAKSELMMTFKGNASEFLDGNVPGLDTAQGNDVDIMKTFAKDCAYWRRQLRGAKLGGSATEIVLDVGLSYGSVNPSKRYTPLLQLCTRILGDMKGTLAQRLRVISKRNKPDSDNLLLMTMHGSKGLEFNTVHVIDAIHRDAAIDTDTTESERRLMYVALTRAKDICTVSYHGSAHRNIAEASIHELRDRDEIVANITKLYPEDQNRSGQL